MPPTSLLPVPCLPERAPRRLSRIDCRKRSSPTRSPALGSGSPAGLRFGLPESPPPPRVACGTPNPVPGGRRKCPPARPPALPRIPPSRQPNRTSSATERRRPARRCRAWTRARRSSPWPAARPSLSIVRWRERASHSTSPHPLPHQTPPRPAPRARRPARAGLPRPRSRPAASCAARPPETVRAEQRGQPQASTRPLCFRPPARSSSTHGSSMTDKPDATLHPHPPQQLPHPGEHPCLPAQADPAAPHLMAWHLLPLRWDTSCGDIPAAGPPSRTFGRQRSVFVSFGRPRQPG